MTHTGQIRKEKIYALIPLRQNVPAAWAVLGISAACWDLSRAVLMNLGESCTGLCVRPQAGVLHHKC